MTLSPTERQQVVELVAQRVIDELRNEAGGDLATLIVLPMSAVSAHVGLSTKTASERLPVTMVAPGKAGVTLAHLRAYIAEKTRFPKGWTAPTAQPSPQSPHQTSPQPPVCV